jgi:hypothetical protein
MRYGFDVTHPLHEELALDLPALGDTDDGVDGIEHDLVVRIATFEDGDDPFDDAVADDLSINVTLTSTENEPSALGDDNLGLVVAETNEVAFAETDASLLDEGDDGRELDFHGDDNLGIDPIPHEVDDGGVEGLDDPLDEPVDVAGFPPMDGAEDDDRDELDLGIEIATLRDEPES